jgi:hypothetical protein
MAGADEDAGDGAVSKFYVTIAYRTKRESVALDQTIDAPDQYVAVKDAMEKTLKRFPAREFAWAKCRSEESL